MLDSNSHLFLLFLFLLISSNDKIKTFAVENQLCGSWHAVLSPSIFVVFVFGMLLLVYHVKEFTNSLLKRGEVFHLRFMTIVAFEKPSVVLTGIEENISSFAFIDVIIFEILCKCLSRTVRK